MDEACGCWTGHLVYPAGGGEGGDDDTTDVTGNGGWGPGDKNSHDCSFSAVIFHPAIKKHSILFMS